MMEKGMIRLDEKQVTLFVEKLRARAEEDSSIGTDVTEVLLAAIREDKKEPAEEIAKTLCEILEPERIGGIVWMACKLCKERLEDQEVMNKVDTCFSCRITGGRPETGTCW